jgi:hypothetical protein
MGYGARGVDAYLGALGGRSDSPSADGAGQENTPGSGGDGADSQSREEGSLAPLSEPLAPSRSRRDAGSAVGERGGNGSSSPFGSRDGSAADGPSLGFDYADPLSIGTTLNAPPAAGPAIAPNGLSQEAAIRPATGAGSTAPPPLPKTLLDSQGTGLLADPLRPYRPK